MGEFDAFLATLEAGIRSRPLAGEGAYVDTACMRDDEYFTAHAYVEVGETCPNCHVAKANWDCAGCGLEWVA